MNCWLHRITGGDNALPLSSALLDKGFLSIGWSDFSSETCLKTIRAGRESFDKLFLDEGWGLPRNRWNLWRFVIEMSQGDLIVVPLPYSFSVYQIADDTLYTNESIDPSLLIDWNGNPVIRQSDGDLYNKDGKAVDLGFYRRVIPVEKNIPRSEYADQDLYSRMKIRQTNAQMNDLLGSVRKAVEDFRGKKPINLRASILENAAGTVLEKIRTLQNDSKFEDLVQWYLETIGGKVFTPSKNESPTEAGDADRVALFDKLGIAVMVQVKKHSGQTDSWAIEQINAYKKNHITDEYTSVLWVISTCDSFSQEALQAAQETGVRLINGLDFASMILDAGINGLTL